ncbi:MAG: hypothetical protein C5B47_03535 [Verrucomicrobia bacterium]|nr:MAG: hypothetical protein C5B47_03535 [Verrucomicrobiota bacterium]
MHLLKKQPAPKLSDFRISGGLLTILVAYCASYLLLLCFSDFLPYVMDNNETWSNLAHAKNTYDYGISKNKGLADEACEYSGENPSAHPLVHTHQGNFPRLWATLLYFLGFQTAREQIAITTFTIGVMSLLAAFGLTRRVFGETVAVLFCLFMMTDYLLFAQWQVNTWRVWQGLFFFGALYLTHRLSRDGGRLDRWILLALLFLAIFYSELVFASFVWTATVVYAAILCWRGQKKMFLKIATVVTIGGVLAGVILAGQLIAYYGYTSMLRDAYYTVTLRNIISDPEKLAEAVKFMQEKDVLFLRNFANNPGVYSVTWLITSVFRGILGPWSPMFLILSGLGFGALLIHWIVNSGVFREEFLKLAYADSAASPSANRGPSFTQSAAFIVNRLALCIVWMGWCFLLLNVLKDYLSWTGSVQGNSRAYSMISESAINLVVILGAAIFFAWASLRFNYDVSKKAAKTQYLVTGAILLAGIAFVVSRYQSRFSSDWKSIWNLMMMPKVFPYLLVAGILGGALYLVAHVFMAGDPRFAIFSNKFEAALPLLFATGAAFLMAWFWSPGYLATGYLDRCCPIATYTMYLIPALALWGYGLSAKVWLGNFQSPLLQAPLGLACVAGAAIGAGTIMLTFWVRVQAVSVELLPPTFGRLMAVLESAMFQGKGLAASNYTVPAAFSTKSWGWNPGYWTENMAKNVPPVPLRWNPENLWISEKGKTLKYAQPEFYIFYDQPYSLNIGASRAESLLRREKAPPRYLNASIVRTAVGLEKSPFQHQLVVKDESRWDAWVIVRLDHKPIPYLGGGHPPAQPLSSLSVPEKKPFAKWWPDIHVEFVPHGDILIVGKPILEIVNSEIKKIALISARERLLNPGVENVISSFRTVATGHVSIPPDSSLKFVFHQDAPSGTLYVWQGEQLRVFSRDNKEASDLNNQLVLQVNEVLPKDVSDTPKQAHVRFTSQRVGANELAVTPAYAYLHSEKIPESGSCWKLWNAKNDGTLKLVSETTDRQAFRIHPEDVGTLILSVIPKDAQGRSGFEYFSAPFNPKTNGNKDKLDGLRKSLGVNALISKQ